MAFYAQLWKNVALRQEALLEVKKINDQAVEIFNRHLKQNPEDFEAAFYGANIWAVKEWENFLTKNLYT